MTHHFNALQIIARSTAGISIPWLARSSKVAPSARSINPLPVLLILSLHQVLHGIIQPPVDEIAMEAIPLANLSTRKLKRRRPLPPLRDDLS